MTATWGEHLLVTHLGRKLLRLLLVVLAVTAVTFLMVHLLPGDVAYTIGGETATADDIRAIREALGLDRSMLAQYRSWLGRLVHGDLGRSYLTGEPVLQAILSRLPVTLELLVISQLLALALALPAALICAYRSGSHVDRLISTGGFATLSIPSFVMALLTIYLFSVKLRWLPATGYTPLQAGVWANLKSFVLPALSIALIEWVVLMRVLRSDLITTLQQHYILMAKAKGLPPWRILLLHALRPSAFTMLTVMGLQVGRLLGEAVIVETLFALPGMGRLLVTAIYARDHLMVQGCVLVISIGYVTVNSAVDMLYTLLDPRIRREAAVGT
ncbi:MAG: ABC transporter permease [Desulfosarcinaceae bacterium]|nr:ABC transporter permease [Desulfosarcinaceae bacterium]